MSLQPETDRGFRLTGRHVLIMLLAFFGVVIAVNITFVNLALDSWTGLTDHDSYRTGLSWNRTLERDAEQKAMGWSTGIETKAEKTADGAAWKLAVTLTLRDRDGKPITGLAVDGRAWHPVLEADDRSLSFSEAGGGVYLGSAVLPGAGDWTLKLALKRPDRTVYRIETVATVR